jgi:hypothetical protein
MVGKDALASERGVNSVNPGAGLQRNHVGGFENRTFDRVPAPTAPTFNQSSPYAIPQSPERPVSPASPGSVFGDR